jgi:hypothetical protein
LAAQAAHGADTWNNSAQLHGPENKKNPATGEVFFLAFPFTELVGH